MTDLSRLSVSLTKHGAHKLSTLLKHIGAKDILANTLGSIEGVNIDAGQARKLLSADRKGKVADVWSAVQKDNDFSIRSMVTCWRHASRTIANAHYLNLEIPG